MDIKEETANINSHVEKGNFHAGINLAISAMNACRREEDQEGVDYFLALIQGIVNTMVAEFGSK